jgi:hypothetical protein
LEYSLPKGDVLLRNVLAAHRGRLNVRLLERLLVLAAQDGEIDARERALLDSLPWPTDCRHMLDATLAHVDAGEVLNLEVEAMRLRDPHFDARVAALVAHAKPGDVVVWSSDQQGPPWNLMRAAYGPWMHVSVVLDDGRLLDPYWPDGVTVSTPEAAIAKSFNRVMASEFLIARLAVPLDEAQLQAFSNAARAALGKPYSFVAMLDRPASASSCSRVAWDLFRSIGLDLAPAGSRMYRSAISPVDFVFTPLAHVRVDGSIDLTPPRPTRPTGLVAYLTARLDDVMSALPTFQRFLFGFQAPVTWIFMTGMARLGRETRPGFRKLDEGGPRLASHLTKLDLGLDRPG